jgi:aspartokinase-like uncharacterized kinase
VRAVLKLGGSLARSTALDHWLRAAARSGRGRVVIVPGGGPFADTVRCGVGELPATLHRAHRMAILAMEQSGLALADRVPGLVACETMAAIERALASGQVPVWRPLRMVDGVADIRPGWRVTSDSLAAWLAPRIGAGRVILVKSCAIGSDDVRELARQGIVDAALPAYIARAGVPLSVLNKRAWRSLPQLLGRGGSAR